ncbi:MAG: hypothetical protein AB1721_02955 [Patescibacteria group bacterium]
MMIGGETAERLPNKQGKKIGGALIIAGIAVIGFSSIFFILSHQP